MVLTNLKVRLLQADEPAYVIATKTGMHPSQLSEYALGKKEIRPKHLRALARYFKCKQTEILGTSEFSLDGAVGPHAEFPMGGHMGGYLEVESDGAQ